MQDKSKAKSVVKIVIVAVVCLLLVWWALPPLLQKTQQSATPTYKGILQLWNVESFEGGSGSRHNWLVSASAKFEKSHVGLFVHVTTLTVEQAQNKLENGDLFDIITFGRGLGCDLLPHLQPTDLPSGNLRYNMVASGVVKGNQYALPLYSGGYALFARSSQIVQDTLLKDSLTNVYTRKLGKNTIQLQPLTCGFTPYNSPLTALALANVKGNASTQNTNVTQYGAYEQFVGNKTAVTLLGTQRDAYRLTQRLNNGKIEQIAFCPLYGYTDLVQYVGISKDVGEKQDVCMEYLQHLLSPTVQQSLTNLSLFCALEQNLYTEGWFADMEQALADAYVPNVFADLSAIQNQRQTAVATLGMQ